MQSKKTNFFKFVKFQALINATEPKLSPWNFSHLDFVMLMHRSNSSSSKDLELPITTILIRPQRKHHLYEEILQIKPKLCAIMRMLRLLQNLNNWRFLTYTKFSETVWETKIDAGILVKTFFNDLTKIMAFKASLSSPA